ncbi:MAG: ankyrin repeat domain-containing protein [Leptospiraceae bacterium]|nr:ankyrin repeat domain-containing protein [Leptospiraceae bacterium]MCP5512812.1 ankyrin repeat domain-containing protein [Leptospiraceae bacterium]
MKSFYLFALIPFLFLSANTKEDLIEAVTDTNIPKLTELLSKEKIDLNAADSHNRTSLMIASSDNNLTVVKLLVEAGADINRKNKENGRTALMYASVNGHYDVVKYLIEQESNLINAKDKEGKTALIHAVMGGRMNVIKLLIENKANVNSRTYTDDSALSFALKTGKVEIINLLRNSGGRE